MAIGTNVQSNYSKRPHHLYVTPCGSECIHPVWTPFYPWFLVPTCVRLPNGIWIISSFVYFFLSFLPLSITYLLTYLSVYCVQAIWPENDCIDKLLLHPWSKVVIKSLEFVALLPLSISFFWMSQFLGDLFWNGWIYEAGVIMGRHCIKGCRNKNTLHITYLKTLICIVFQLFLHIFDKFFVNIVTMKYVDYTRSWDFLLSSWWSLPQRERWHSRLSLKDVHVHKYGGSDEIWCWSIKHWLNPPVAQYEIFATHCKTEL